jgi:sensor histidine kinase YesM
MLRLAAEHGLRCGEVARVHTSDVIDDLLGRTLIVHGKGDKERRVPLTGSMARTHPLAAEFDRLADYLALMQIRMGPRLRYRLDLPDDLRNVPVPPLLLQPLVKNSIRHGLEPKVEGGEVVVQARREGLNLRIEVRDTGVGLNQASTASHNGTGFGLTQIRSRLTSVYGSAAALNLAAAPGGGTCATLVLPLESL